MIVDNQDSDIVHLESMTFVSRERQSEFNTRAMFRLGAYLHLAAQAHDSLLHTQKSKMIAIPVLNPMLVVESMAIVLHSHLQRGRLKI